MLAKVKVKGDNMNDKINKVLDKIRPSLQSDGGDIEFRKYENGILYVKLVGACSHCPYASQTLKEGIEEVLKSEIPEIIKVINED